MPNGGTHHCYSCCNFRRDANWCALRNRAIGSTHWTSCGDFDERHDAPHGPLYAIVCEVKDGGGSYATIPYWDDVEPQSVQDASTVDSYITVHLANGMLRFEGVREYLAAHAQAFPLSGEE
jgi:hypothetical protein